MKSFNEENNKTEEKPSYNWFRYSNAIKKYDNKYNKKYRNKTCEVIHLVKFARLMAWLLFIYCVLFMFKEPITAYLLTLIK